MKTALDALWASITRTLVPIIAGALITWAVNAGIELDPELAPTLNTLLTATFTAAYYLAARLLERYVSPRFGWLLGLAQQPTSYKPDPPAGVQADASPGA